MAAKLLLARTILLAPPELQPVELTILDPKEDIDFSFLNGLPRFYSGDAAPQGFNDFFKAYIQRKTGEDTAQHLKILFVDEFASLVQLIEDKKEREAAQGKLALCSCSPVPVIFLGSLPHNSPLRKSPEQQEAPAVNSSARCVCLVTVAVKRKPCFLMGTVARG